MKSYLVHIMWHMFSISRGDYLWYCICSEERQRGAVERGQAYELNSHISPCKLRWLQLKINFACLLGKTKASVL